MLAGLRIALLGAWASALLGFGALAVYRAFQILPTYLAAEFLRWGFDGLDQERKTSGSGMDDSDLAAIIPGPQPKPSED